MSLVCCSIRSIIVAGSATMGGHASIMPGYRRLLITTLHGCKYSHSQLQPHNFTEYDMRNSSAKNSVAARTHTEISELPICILVRVASLFTS